MLERLGFGGRANFKDHQTHSGHHVHLQNSRASAKEKGKLQLKRRTVAYDRKRLKDHFFHLNLGQIKGRTKPHLLSGYNWFCIQSRRLTRGRIQLSKAYSPFQHILLVFLAFDTCYLDPSIFRLASSLVWETIFQS